jgi:hypothetical protein
MKILGLQFNPFDIFIAIIALVTIIFFCVKGYVNNETYRYAYAFMTALVYVGYVKVSEIRKNP